MYEKKGLEIIAKTLRYFTSIFTLLLFVRLFMKIISNQYGNKVYGLYFEEINLTLSAILEIAAFSLILSVISLLILSDIFLVRMRFLFRSFLFFISILFITMAFAVLFGWLEFDRPIAWLSFFLTFFICFAIGIGIKLLKFRLDDKKYTILLEKYKSRHNTKNHSS